MDDGEWKDQAITGISRTGSFSGISRTGSLEGERILKGSFKLSISRTSYVTTASESAFSHRVHIQSGDANNRVEAEHTQLRGGRGSSLSQVGPATSPLGISLPQSEMRIDDPLDIKNVPRARVYQNRVLSRQVTLPPCPFVQTPPCFLLFSLFRLFW